VIIFTRPRYAGPPNLPTWPAGRPSGRDIHIVPELTAAIDQAISMRSEDLIVITGSLFTVGEAKSICEVEMLSENYSAAERGPK